MAPPSENSDAPAPGVPVYPNDDPIVWDDNNGSLDGILHDFFKYLVTTGEHEMLFQHRAVPLRNGNLAVEDMQSCVFLNDPTVDDPHDFSDPCPPTATRITKWEATATAKKGSAVKFTHITTLPDGFRVAPWEVKADDTKLLAKLKHVIQNSLRVDSLVEGARGSGLALLTKLRELAANANDFDKTLVSTEFTDLVRRGVGGELTLESLTKFLKEYQAKRRNLSSGTRPADATEAQMITRIALSDPGLREMYEVKTATTKPTTLEDAAKVARDILTNRIRAEQIDAANRGEAPTPALAAGKAPVKPSPCLATVLASLDAPDRALVLAAIADPKKHGKDDEKDKEKDEAVKAPRNKDGSVSKWIKGMSNCKFCSKPGHLNRDCTSEAAVKARASYNSDMATTSTRTAALRQTTG
jgi:hypothetical protein